jgi:hypothetical protein
MKEIMLRIVVDDKDAEEFENHFRLQAIDHTVCGVADLARRVGAVIHDHDVLVKDHSGPTCVGFWVMEGLIKWGKDGDSVFPYPTEEDARDQVAYLREEHDKRPARHLMRPLILCILKVFDNGQILTIEVD